MEPPAPTKWHVRRQKPTPNTTLFWFIDNDANRMTYGQFLDELESDEAFRSQFIGVLSHHELRLFVWETPSITKPMLVGELECAITEAPPPPKRFRVIPSMYGAHFKPDELAVTFTEGETKHVTPCPREAEGWYADLGVFLRRVKPVQVHALWQKFAAEVKQSVGTERIWLSSSAPGAPWLSLKIENNNKNRAYTRYGR
jgi:hypothetical protein